MLNEDKKYNIENINDIYSLVTVSGKKPDIGSLYVNNKGQVAISIIIDKKCYVKDFYSEVTEYDKDDTNCDLGYVGTDSTVPSVELSISGTKNNDWYINETYVSINATDNESGVLNIKWCLGENCTPNNEENSSTKSILVPDSTGTKVCVIVTDRALNINTKCSEIIKVDRVSPSFNGIADETIAINAPFDLSSGVTVNDETSGVNDYTCNNTTCELLDTSVAGTKEIIYKAVDNAGNETSITRKIVVSATAPNITFNPEANVINANGWANKDFYVSINVTDNSNNGIKEIKACTATTDTCDPELGVTVPNDEATRYITTESSNNRICVKATDNDNKTSETMCSDAYKLDKTAPTVGSININGTKGEGEWYTSSVTITPIDGTDDLSGHNSTTININSITNDTTGTIVTVTTTDKAGNTSTDNYTIKVDKTSPTISYDLVGGTYYEAKTINVIATDDNFSYMYVDVWKDGTYVSAKSGTKNTSTSSVTLDSDGHWEVFAMVYDLAGNRQNKQPDNGSGWYYQIYDVIIDTESPNINTTLAGESLYDDPTFESGYNSIQIYNNLGNDSVTMDRISMVTPYGNHAIKMATTGEAQPAYGGFWWTTQMAPNKVFITRIVAKVPVGYSLQWTGNQMGDDGTYTWLTDSAGTGEWKEYIVRLDCGSTGLFGLANHFFAWRPDGATPTYPLEWYVAYADSYDTTINGENKNLIIGATDDKGIVSYGIGTSETVEPTMTNITSTTKFSTMLNASNGNYYLWVKDIAGKITKKAFTVSGIVTYGTNIQSNYENLYDGYVDGVNGPTTPNTFYDGPSYAGNFKYSFGAHQHISAASVGLQASERNPYGAQSIIAGQNTYTLLRKTNLNRWIGVQLYGRYGSGSYISISNFKIHFTDGNAYTINEALDNNYIEPLVIVGSSTDTGSNDYEFTITDIMKILDGSTTSSNHYPIVSLMFKVRNVAVTAISFNSSHNFEAAHDGLEICEAAANYEISTTPF